MLPKNLQNNTKLATNYYNDVQYFLNWCYIRFISHRIQDYIFAKTKTGCDICQINYWLQICFQYGDAEDDENDVYGDDDDAEEDDDDDDDEGPAHDPAPCS